MLKNSKGFHDQSFILYNVQNIILRKELYFKKLLLFQAEANISGKMSNFRFIIKNHF